MDRRSFLSAAIAGVSAAPAAAAPKLDSLSPEPGWSPLYEGLRNLLCLVRHSINQVWLYQDHVFVLAGNDLYEILPGDRIQLLHSGWMLGNSFNPGIWGQYT